ncbi:NACHT domain-containing protein [Actinoplanes xinjiangensis]|uniref:Uncharacterized protein n=1 Tax=Actinoplanes xinjiangensis TaxID=512350 RepID=A0A316ECX6_9ACTN|nr:hypothetical protein [Actinoplanes xinjiangensis]PWK27225.1 hypothetical protein BC793_1567 [Actinoplanes xinjiangensis]GIF45257.1 hypothetical protein Axi01nite_95680 [Actinoplanes xinjiangensis]
MPVEQTARIVAPSRSSLRPLTLARVRRQSILQRAMSRRDSDRRVVMLTGEGGIGKSVLLGQWLDAIDAGPAGGAAVLVACGDVQLSDTGLTRDKVDDAFGAAVGGQSLLEILNTSQANHRRVTLLVDTLDLLVGPGTIAPIAALLAAALEIGDVVVTCRHDEYRAYFQNEAQATPQLADRVTAVPLPPLSPEEVVDWAQQYADSHPAATGADDVEAAAFMASLREGLWREGAIRDICTIPLRLRLTCEVFARDGHLPEELTVTGLYDAYWENRVALHGGRRCAEGDAKQDAALAVAARLLGADGHLALTVPNRRLDAALRPGLRWLASEGVLIETKTGWQFFHQSFAEYAVARWMLEEGIDAEPIAGLSRQLTAGLTRLWTIAGSVLAQVGPDDADSFTTLAALLPPTGPVAVQAHTVAALHQRNPAVLTSLVTTVRARPELWPAMLPDLGKAPRDAEAVPAVVAGALDQDARALAGPVATAFTSLAGRARPEHAAAVVSTALEAFKGVRKRRELDAKVVDQHVGRVLQTQQRPVTMNVLDNLLDDLPGYVTAFGPQFRQAVVRVFLSNAEALDEQRILTFGRAMLTVDAPPLDDMEPVALMRLLWRCEPLRAERGWSCWRTLIGSELPAGLWHNAVVRFAAALAGDDFAVRAEIVDDMVQGRGAGTAHVNAFEHVAAAYPAWVAERLRAGTVPADRIGIGAVTSSSAAFAAGLPAGDAAAMADWLIPALNDQPRLVWPARITLSGGSVPRQTQLFDELAHSNPPNEVLGSAVDAWLFRTTVPVIDELTPQLRAVLASSDADVLQTRARLEGRLAPYDPAARAWIRDHVLDRPSTRIASTAVKTVSDVLCATDGPMNAATAGWLAELVTTPHHDACRGIVVLLTDDQRTDAPAFAALLATLVPKLVNRFETSVRDGANAQLSQALLNCLIRADRADPLPADTVRSLFDAAWTSIPTSTAPSAIVKVVTNLCGTLLAKRLPTNEVRELVGASLAGFDPVAIANKTVRAIASLLGGVARRDPAGPAWLEELFWRHDTTLSTRLAIAEALLSMDDHRATSRAQHLTQQPGCPDEVIAYVLPRLRG